MKIILFDLGDTLEYKKDSVSVLRDDALELLSGIQYLHDNDRKNLVVSLISDWDQEPLKYYHLLEELGISHFFKPHPEKVTLSNEVGVTKPHEKIFRTAIDKIQKDLQYRNVIFITENKDHIIAARKYGMMAIRINFPGKKDGEVNTLIEMLPFINLFSLMVL
jgi:FMN phosphatase YigB (HAD superfamily)